MILQGIRTRHLNASGLRHDKGMFCAYFNSVISNISLRSNVYLCPHTRCPHIRRHSCRPASPTPPTSFTYEHDRRPRNSALFTHALRAFSLPSFLLRCRYVAQLSVQYQYQYQKKESKAGGASTWTKIRAETKSSNSERKNRGIKTRVRCN